MRLMPYILPSMSGTAGFFYITPIFLALLCSCTSQHASDAAMPGDAGTQTYCFKDSCRNLVVSLSLELPLGGDSVSVQIRDSLIADFIVNAQQPCRDQENTLGIKPYTGDMGDPQAVVDYYGKADYAFLLSQAMADYNERMKCLDEDTTMTDDERQSIKSEVPQWTFELSLTKATDTPTFVVYQSQAYVYYGGAHGGLTGSGALTFDKTTGSKIHRFVKAGAAKAMQPLIRKGLLQYYSYVGDTITDRQLSERLQIEGTTIPLPVNAAYPNETGDSLTFTYRQYEIACYADGMPSFALSVADLMPYLTPDGRSILKNTLPRRKSVVR